MTREQADRVSRIRAVCRDNKRNEHVQLDKLGHMKVDLKNKIIVCVVPYTGSSILHNTLTSDAFHTTTPSASYFVDDGIVHTDGMLPLNKYRAVQAKSMLINFRKVMFARHPLDRLAFVYYKNVIIGLGTGGDFNMKHGRTIIRKFRTNPSKDSLRTGRNVTFSEFVKYIIHLWDNNIRFDFDWKPIYELCLPCSIAYDFVGHFEYLKEDLHYILKSLDNEFSVKYSRFQTDFSNKNMRDVYRNIPSGDIMKLKEIYEMDFLMHNYSYTDIW